MAGITLATKGGDAFTAETFEHVALAAGCQLVDDGGDVTLDLGRSAGARSRSTSSWPANYSPGGMQDVDTHARHLLRRRAPR